MTIAQKKQAIRLNRDNLRRMIAEMRTLRAIDGFRYMAALAKFRSCWQRRNALIKGERPPANIPV